MKARDSQTGTFKDIYVKALDNTMKTYLTGYAKIAVISFPLSSIGRSSN